MLTEFGFSGGLNTSQVIKSQEIKERILIEKHKNKHKSESKQARKNNEKGLAPYELFLKRLKAKEISTKRKIINKRAWAIFKKHQKEMLKKMDLQNPEYKPFSKWRLAAYRDQELTRSLNGITAGKAWTLLTKCWDGFIARAKNGDIDGMKYYAEGIDKYLWLLEEPALEWQAFKGRE